MEYVAGGDLKALLLREKLTIERVVKMAIDLASALTRAHQLNIIHRDLKPANILIGADKTAKLSDFGIAWVQRLERLTSDDGMVGTLNYMAPEMISEGVVDKRSDIWSFGTVLFEMVAGVHPFVGDNVGTSLQNILSGTSRDLEKLCPDCPRFLLDLIQSMIAPDPQNRISSARQVGAALEAQR